MCLTLVNVVHEQEHEHERLQEREHKNKHEWESPLSATVGFHIMTLWACFELYSSGLACPGVLDSSHRSGNYYQSDYGNEQANWSLPNDLRNPLSNTSVCLSLSSASACLLPYLGNTLCI